MLEEMLVTEDMRLAAAFKLGAASQHIRGILSARIDILKGLESQQICEKGATEGPLLNKLQKQGDTLSAVLALQQDSGSGKEGCIKIVNGLVEVFQQFIDDRQSCGEPVKDPRVRWDEFVGEALFSLYDRLDVNHTELIHKMSPITAAYKDDVHSKISEVLSSIDIKSPKAGQGR